MDNKFQLVSSNVTIKQEQHKLHHHHHQQQQHQQQQQQQQDSLVTEQNNNENFSQQPATTPPSPSATTTTPAPTTQLSPKVTVSLPKYAASKLLDLVQRRDIALLRLGIISVQFENDQIIPLTLNNATNSNNQTLKHQHQQAPPPPPPQLQLQATLASPLQQQHLQVQSSEPITIESCNGVNVCVSNLNTRVTTLDGLASPANHESIIRAEEEEELNSNNNLMNTSPTITSPILNNSSNPSPLPPITTSASLASQCQPTTTITAVQTITKLSSNHCNNSNSSTNLAVVYEEDEEDKDEDKDDEDEVVNEEQHSSYNIHQLNQLEFPDPIELEMYDNDNDLLFPDYTLNLS